MRSKHRMNVLIFVVLIHFILVSLLFTVVAFSATEEEVSSKQIFDLQQIVDEAQPGDTLVLAEGNYLGPVVINKVLHIQGSNQVLLTNDSPEAAIMIQAEGVVVEGFNIRQNYVNESAAIVVTADEVGLKDLNIQTKGYGILLRDADRGTVLHNSISWLRTKNIKTGEKGNGIDLYNSHNNTIEQNKIQNMRDGIYLENSRQLKILNNQLMGSRYGIHCMYIDGSEIIGNLGEYNITGAMIMGVRDVLVSNNSFLKQSKNVNAQGILLYSVQNSVIEQNIVEGNRVGIYIESSQENQIRENSILRNFIGIQFVHAESNKIHDNDFVSNVIEAEATDSDANEIEQNYWDSAQGLDLNKDGISEIPYAINPFYQELISKTPAFQLFFQSTGMTFLSSMYTNNQESWTKDSSPLMKMSIDSISKPPPSSTEKGNISETTFMLLITSTLLITSVAIIFYSGVSKS
ncbi:hypothetical protein EJP82_13215 [Paenibacillus anaericanus]|uniref:Carbohydrate-binding/sugar hydrolysis domain-containing protein n=2 Tax=Paenibacillus TaxID=44249 RepID=A0A3S1DPR3_9BACL|nr:NosD domain-containing protein [Paenibacillus anaericanus]RUT46227.1 hypothetical protein EJP82_13215 [Paenibacillus anaericanus]